jgi:hypothetical protein
VARKQSGADEPEDGKRRQVSIDDDLIRKVRVIASSLGMTVPDYVNHRLRPVVDEELPRVLRQLGFKPED